MERSDIRRTWTYKLGQNIILIEKEDKDLRVVIQDSLSPEKLIDKIFDDKFVMLRNIQMTFYFPDKDMMIKNKYYYDD